MHHDLLRLQDLGVEFIHFIRAYNYYIFHSFSVLSGERMGGTHKDPLDRALVIIYN